MSAGNGITAGSERVTSTLNEFADVADVDSQREDSPVAEAEERATAELQRLLPSGFQCQSSAESDPALLVFVRWWSSGVVDVVRVWGEDGASGYRLIDLPSLGWGVGPTGIVMWQRKGSSCEVVAAVLELPNPDLVALAPHLSTRALAVRDAGGLSIS